MELDHLIVPVKAARASAERLARILDVPWSDSGTGRFVAVYVSDGLTLDLDTTEGELPVLHFAFRVSEAEFDAILGRLRSLRIPWRSSPHGPVDGKVGTAAGGRNVYWNEPDGHVWEILTVSYARPGTPPAAG